MLAKVLAASRNLLGFAAVCKSRRVSYGGKGGPDGPVGEVDMSGPRVSQQEGGWGMVFAVALLGLALAALVVLTPWHLRDLSGQRTGPQSAHDSVITVHAPSSDPNTTIPSSDGAPRFLTTSYSVTPY
jgi:hypothetical protein